MALIVSTTNPVTKSFFEVKSNAQMAVEFPVEENFSEKALGLGFAADHGGGCDPSLTNESMFVWTVQSGLHEGRLNC